MLTKNFISFSCGIFFGLGLAISEMINPMKVKSFLDITGNWDPSLIFVMIGAIFVTFIVFFLSSTKTDPSFISLNYLLPKRSQIDSKLTIGAILFGIGWGLVGFCPGPAIAALAEGKIITIYFMLSMISGIIVYRLYNK